MVDCIYAPMWIVTRHLDFCHCGWFFFRILISIMELKYVVSHLYISIADFDLFSIGRIAPGTSLLPISV